MPNKQFNETRLRAEITNEMAETERRIVNTVTSNLTNLITRQCGSMLVDLKKQQEEETILLNKKIRAVETWADNCLLRDQDWIKSLREDVDTLKSEDSRKERMLADLQKQMDFQRQSLTAHSIKVTDIRRTLKKLHYADGPLLPDEARSLTKRIDQIEKCLGGVDQDFAGELPLRDEIQSLNRKSDSLREDLDDLQQISNDQREDILAQRGRIFNVEKEQRSTLTNQDSSSVGLEHRLSRRLQQEDMALENRLKDRLKDQEAEIVELKKAMQRNHQWPAHMARGKFEKLEESFMTLASAMGPLWLDQEGYTLPITMLSTTHLENVIEGRFGSASIRKDIERELARRKKDAAWTEKTMKRRAESNGEKSMQEVARVTLLKKGDEFYFKGKRVFIKAIWHKDSGRDVVTLRTMGSRPVSLVVPLTEVEDLADFRATIDPRLKRIGLDVAKLGGDRTADEQAMARLERVTEEDKRLIDHREFLMGKKLTWRGEVVHVRRVWLRANGQIRCTMRRQGSGSPINFFSDVKEVHKIVLAEMGFIGHLSNQELLDVQREAVMQLLRKKSPFKQGGMVDNKTNVPFQNGGPPLKETVLEKGDKPPRKTNISFQDYMDGLTASMKEIVERQHAEALRNPTTAEKLADVMAECDKLQERTKLDALQEGIKLTEGVAYVTVEAVAMYGETMLRHLYQTDKLVVVGYDPAKMGTDRDAQIKDIMRRARTPSEKTKPSHFERVMRYLFDAPRHQEARRSD